MSWRDLNNPRRYEKSIVKGVFGGGSEAKSAAKTQAGASSDAARIQAESAEKALAEQRRQFDIGQRQIAPFRAAGIRGLATGQRILGLGGKALQEKELQKFQESPGQAFLRERGERALLRNQAAIGGLGGGNIRSALQEQGIGVASQQLGEFQNRLAALSGSGQTATQAGAQLGQQSAANISNLLQQSGQAQASGILGAGQATSQGILGAQQANAALGGQVLGAGLGAAAGGGLFGAGAASLAGGSAGAGALLGLFSDARLKENIIKVGNLDSGLSIYTWSWSKKGKEIVGDQTGFGVIAQEAQELFPDAVKEVDGFLQVNYEAIS